MSLEFNYLMVSENVNRLQVAELSEFIEGKFKYLDYNSYFLVPTIAFYL